MPTARLAETLERQDAILKELLEVVVQQREVMKTGKLADMQELMSRMRHVSVRCQAIETKRSRVTEELAGTLSCEPVVSSLLEKLSPEEKIPLEEVARKVMETVSLLKVEMLLLPRLMEEARALNEMLISEWRRISEESGFSGGGFDAKI